LRAAGALGLLAGLCVAFTAATDISPPPPGIGQLAHMLRHDQWVVPLVLVAATTTATYLWLFIVSYGGPELMRASPFGRRYWATALIAGT
jgi:hypothetical protein